ncbi:response regulator [Desulfonatronum thiodismutans]|uniref:response regulator n=1 Tax=Desulfonatronum thiodismutans TaxID=159290 RepID=UPI00068C43A8|nr:response regulator [Desulfonatronum thiodismutans]
MPLLVVESDQLFRDNLVHHLHQRDFTVYTGENLDDVLRLLGERTFRVILLGLSGVGRKGLEMLRSIRANSPLTNVILMTTPDCLQYSIEGMKMGAFDDILAPCDIDLLCAKIKLAETKPQPIFPDAPNT